MRRPSIPRKPDVPSVHPVIGAAIGRARRQAPLSRDERPMTEAELIADIERALRLPPGIFDRPSRSDR
jgi:hypothetical protein